MGPFAADDVFALFDDWGAGDGGALLLRRPQRLVVCDDPAEVEAALAALEDGMARGLWAAGCFAYELGYALEPALAAPAEARPAGPLLWFGLFEPPERLDAAATAAFLASRVRGPHRIGAVVPGLDREAYRAAFARAKALIDAGDVYQVNLTFPLAVEVEGDPVGLYRALRRRQRAACAGLISAPGLSVLSLSPELFLRLAGGRALTRPMKGTARRGATAEADAAIRRELAQDPKSRAENLMIVDLMRNDLGRLATVGGVAVTDLFTVETLPTLHQMTSGVEAALRPGVGLGDLLRALFPCGSVTGAPKIRAMQVIRELERAPRGVYTGALGLFRREPDGALAGALNVAIRTLTIRGGCGAPTRGTFGVGSGIVADSDADAEYDECLLKAAFLTGDEPPTLLETLRWSPDEGWALLERHLARLAASAAWFGTPPPAGAAAALARAAEGFPRRPMRVRLTVDADGAVAVGAEPLAPPPPLLRYAISDRPVRSSDPLLRHKTTARAFYEGELARWRAARGCDEVAFVNERGELTEGSWTNLFVRRGDMLLTPPVACGLLDGVLRRHLLETRPDRVAEAALRPQDLRDADEVLFGNSVRGLMPAVPAT